jgi:4-amino-4-deoxy-L-arabinose transferase-like glycosyltransferase
VSLLLVLLFGVFLRFYHLDGYGLWSDEFVTLMIVLKSSWLELIRTCFQIPQPMPPLYFLLDRLFVDLLGPNETSLRLLSAFSSALVVYFVFAIGRMLFDFEVGVFAALLCAVNSIQIVYAQNARPYAFCLLLSTISILSFLQWTKSETKVRRLSFIVATTLLLYAHYIFFLVLLIQNLYFFWLRRSQTHGKHPASARSWKSWLFLQLCVGILLTPLAPQLWAIFRSGQTLNWASGLAQYYPRYEAFFFFLNPRYLFLSLVLTLAIFGGGLCFKRLLRQSREYVIPQKIPPIKGGKRPRRWGMSRLWVDWVPATRDIPRRLMPASPIKGGILFSSLGAPPQAAWIAPVQTRGRPASQGSLIFVMLWYLTPLALFFALARINVIHLFVERYLILASLATYILLSSIPLGLLPRAAGRTFLIVYLLVYVVAEPGRYFLQKGQFSQGVPGGNEWRETLTHLADPAFNTPLLLFQSPFIESNQLNFSSDNALADYLATPLRSFYVKDQQRPFELLPVHWWIDTEPHRQFKMKIRELLISHQEFTLLSTEEFWTYFKPWMDREMSAYYQIDSPASFESSGALRLRRIKLSTRGSFLAQTASPRP